MSAIAKLIAKRTTTQSLLETPKSMAGRIRQRIQSRSAWREFHDARQLPENPVDSVLPEIVNASAMVTYGAPTSPEIGNMPSHELVILCCICRCLNPSLIFEFGTYDGQTTLHLAMNSPENARVLTIDLAPDDPIRMNDSDDTFYTKGMKPGERFAKSPYAAKVEQIYGDTTKYDHTPLIGKVDMVFVDAGHAYELVRSDSRKAMEMVRPGGMVVWHDYHYCHRGVYTWLNELAKKSPLKNVPNTSLAYYRAPLPL